MLGRQGNGVDLVLEDAEYADEQIQESADRVWANSDEENVTVNVTYPNRDLSGLIVEVSPESSARRSMKPARQRAHIASTLRAHSSVPVRVRLSESEPVPRSRANDSAPWQAGGRLRMAGGGRCTTGWAVIKSDGTGRLLSAGHCNPNAAGNLYDGANDLLSNGNNNQVAPNFDSLLIDPVNGTIAETYLGPYDSSNERRVAGGDAPSQGEEVCVSGANHGEHCHARIDRLGAQFQCWFQGTTESCPGFIIETTAQTGGGILGGTGDSGAPVYIRRNDGRVGARGIYTTGLASGYTSCTGQFWFNADNVTDSQECDTRAGVVGITHLTDRWNVTVESLPAP